MKTLTLASLAGLLASAAFCAELTPRQTVEQSIANYDKDWNAVLDFQYTERDVTKNASEKVKTVELSNVTVIQGTPYSRLIAKNNQPLSPEEARKEEEKYRKALHTRAAESPAQRQRRIEKYRTERRFLHEIPDAFDIMLIGHEILNGRDNYVFRLTPKPGYVPKAKNARMFSDIEGKLWIDQQDLRWSKAEANVVDTISIGWVLARIGPGAHITLEQTKVDAEHWMPKKIDVDGDARIMLVKNRTINQSFLFSDYRRVSSLPAPAQAQR